MKTSARNQFAGTVRAVRQGAVNDEVELVTEGGQAIVATVTRDSSDALGLVPGAAAWALVKASSVILVADAAGARFSARNQLRGRIVRVVPGAVNAEVVLDLDGGGTLAAIVTNDSARSLGLAVGGTATGLFKASNVIVAVPA